MATGLIRRLRVHQRCVRAGESQGGFALMAVLMATMVFGLIVVALLTMAMTDMMVNSGLSEHASGARAADAALETWINELKTSPNAARGKKGLDCSPGASVNIGGTAVSVACDGLEPGGTPVPSGLAGSTSLLLLGGFSGPLGDLSAAPGFLNGWLSPLLNDLDTSLQGSLPGFIHYGDKPLQIDGDVKVKQEGLVWHEKGGVGLPGPAVTVTGRYTQGRVSSLFGGQNNLFTLFRWTPSCGLLDPSFDTTWWDVPFVGTLADNGFHIDRPADKQPRPADFMSCSPANTITDPNWPSPVPAGTFTDAVVRAGKSLPADCNALKPNPAVPVVTLLPGAYNRADTATLNEWLRPGNCDDVTFWFTPGDYYFDAAGVVAGDLNTRSAIVLNDPSSNVVFGTPSGWDQSAGKAPNSAFPAACVKDGTAPGVTLTMSPRTTLKHFEGLVAACSTRDLAGNEKPLLYQASGGDSVQWAATPTAGSTPAGNGFAGASNATRSTLASKPANWPVNATAYDTSESTTQYATANCVGYINSCTPSLAFTGFKDPGAYAFGDPTRAVLNIRGTATGAAFFNLGLGSKTTVDVTFGDGSGSCSALAEDVPRGVMSIDLIHPNFWTAVLPNGCGTAGGPITDVAQLEGATITVRPTAVRNAIFPDCGPWYASYYCDYSVGIDYAWLETTANNKPPAIAHTSVNPTSATPRSMSLFGPVYIPRTQVVVDWQGAPNTEPIFGGGLIARALASGMDWNLHPDAETGKLAGLSKVAGERLVVLRAVVDGQLRATATVRFVDSSIDALSLSPGRQVEIQDWRTCNVAMTVAPDPPPPCDSR